MPERAVDQPFLMPIEDVFGIKGRGTVVTGRIERGVVQTGETVDIVGLEATRQTVVTGVEMFQKTLIVAKRVTTSVVCCGGLTGKRFPVARFWPSQAALHPTPSSPLRCMCWARMKGDDIPRSSQGTGRSFTFRRRT